MANARGIGFYGQYLLSTREARARRGGRGSILHCALCVGTSQGSLTHGMEEVRFLTARASQFQLAYVESFALRTSVGAKRCLRYATPWALLAKSHPERLDRND